MNKRERCRQRRQVGQGALANLGAFTVGLAQQNGGGGASIWDDIYVHVYIVQQIANNITFNTCLHICTQNYTNVLISNGIQPNSDGTSV